MLGSVLGKVGLANDPDDAIVIVEHRQTPDLMFRHCPHTFVDRAVDMTCKCLISHTVINAGMIDVGALCDKTNGDVAVGYHPDHAALTVYDRDGSAIAIGHHSCCECHEIVGIDREHALRHNIAGPRISPHIAARAIHAAVCTESVAMLPSVAPAFAAAAAHV
jgi:hypothetical protein